MTEEIIEPRKQYYANVAFDTRNQGYIPLMAKDKAHARQVLDRMLSEKKNVEIFDIYSEDELPKSEEKEKKVEPGKLTP